MVIVIQNSHKMLTHVPIHVIQKHIIPHLDIKSVLRLRATCGYLNQLQVDEMYDSLNEIPSDVCEKITDDVIQQYPDLEALDMSFTGITKISHLVKLKKLNIYCDKEYDEPPSEYVINLNQLLNLTQLELLKIRYDEEITVDLGPLKNLKKLYLRECKIKNESIASLIQLEKLDCYNNKYITDINTLINLKTLNASGSKCKLGNDGIKQLTNLTKLICSWNFNITKIAHLIKLEKLYTSDNNISDNETINLVKLKILICEYNNNFRQINHLVNLKTLYCHQSNMQEDGISQLTQLENLDCSYTKIKIINSPNITYLNISHCRVSDKEILPLVNVKGLVLQR